MFLASWRLITGNGGGTRQNADRVPPELGTGYPEPGKLGIMPAYGVFARHVHDLELANVNASFEKNDFRPAIECADVEGLEIDNFKAQLAPGVPVAILADNVRGITIRNSPVLDGLTRSEFHTRGHYGFPIVPRIFNGKNPRSQARWGACLTTRKNADRSVLMVCDYTTEPQRTESS